VGHRRRRRPTKKNRVGAKIWEDTGRSALKKMGLVRAELITRQEETLRTEIEEEKEGYFGLGENPKGAVGNAVYGS